MTTHRVGIWHPGLSSNFGDRAIQLATVDMVQVRWPDSQIIQYHSRPEAGAAVYPDRRVSFEGLGPLGSPPRGRRLADLDVLLWGGGSLIQQSSLLYFPWQLQPALSAARSGTKVVCFGTGVEPLKSGVLRAIARHAFDSVFDGAWVRGPYSSQLLSDYGVAPAVPYAVDQATALGTATQDEAAELISSHFEGADGDPTISVSVKAAFLYRGGLLPVSVEVPGPARAARRRHRADFEGAFVSLIRHLVDVVGAKVLMVPMFLDQGDVDVCRRVADSADRGKRVAAMRRPPDPRLLKALLGQMAAHVGVRLHSCILSTSAGTPTLGVGYMAKHWDYFSQIGMEDRLIAERHVTAKSLIDAFDELWAGRSAIRSELQTRIPVVLKQLDEVVDQVLGTVESEVGR